METYRRFFSTSPIRLDHGAVSPPLGTPATSSFVTAATPYLRLLAKPGVTERQAGVDRDLR